MYRLSVLFYFALATLVATLTAFLPAAQAQADSLPNGVAAGDVDQSSVVLWARSTEAGPMTFAYGTDLNASPTTIDSAVMDVKVPVTVTVTGLTPNTQYQYRVTDSAGESEEGTFRTAPEVGTHTGLRFGVSGDNDGELNPYVSLKNVPARDLAFFHLHGDATYADVASTNLDFIATNVDEFRIKFDQVFTSNHGLNMWADLRASTSMFMTIDDHDVFNNFAGAANAIDFSSEV